MQNPIYTVTQNFVKKRQQYMTLLKKGAGETSADKPKLEEFLNEFTQTVKKMNKQYIKTKEDFDTDMKFFK